MDWRMICIAALAALSVGIWYRSWKERKEIYGLIDWLEGSLDRILDGRELEEICEEDDILLGRISERIRRIQHIWKRREREAQEEKEQMKELVSDISHQTKMPIANCRMYLEFLQEESLTAGGQGFLKKAQRQTEKLDFLLQSMVKLSRLETGILQIQCTEADLRETVGRAVSAIVPKAEKKEIKLYMDCPDTVILRHDRKWTEEAVFNVLDNAVKYTVQGGSVFVSIRRQEIFTKLSIQDTGKGIAPERQAKIFGRFYREPEVHDEEGIGIGLYLAREIIEMQKGYITVVSQEGQGADFQIYLSND